MTNSNPPCGLIRQELDSKPNWLSDDYQCKAPRLDDRKTQCGFYYNEHASTQATGQGIHQ